MYSFLLAALLVILTLSVAALFLLIGAIIVNIMVRVPYAPTQRTKLDGIMSQFDIKQGDIFYDIGCGDGRMLLEAEKHGAKAIGFEISPIPYLKARLNIWLSKSNAQVLYKNFYHVNLSDADAVFCFLIDKVMPQVEEKLQKELRPGIKVVSYAFKMPNWKPDTVINLSPNKTGSPAYVYTK